MQKIIKYLFYVFIIVIVFLYTSDANAQKSHDLKFTELAKRWDDGIPLGNGWLGELIWEKGNNIRLSLDRVDLWDDRPMPEIDKLKFSWVKVQVAKNKYDTVQKTGDEPYEKYPAPTKIPGAALEFNCSAFGKVISNELDIQKALSVIRFENGAVFRNYVHAVNEIGYFSFENLPVPQSGIDDAIPIPELIIPAYNGTSIIQNDNSHAGEGLQKLGYKKAIVNKTPSSILYHQPTWGKNFYEVLVEWKKIASGNIIGSWTITVNKKAFLPALENILQQQKEFASHLKWWNDFWMCSSVSIPDTILEKQYYLELYKIGCVARYNTPPISLQAIWTADNGSLPPWKGDIHNDLNTELSYWPLYSSNHLEEASSFTNWLWKTKDQNKKWTKNYFDIDGLNVPGVTTISGKEMGGWIQYSMSLTTATWLTHHFYMQWKFGMDQHFLAEKCKPYFDVVYKYLKKIMVIDPVTHQYNLPLSSSPEINDNDITAWFTHWTNYDLALVTSFFKEYLAVLKAATGKASAEIEKESLLLPKFDINETGLTVSPGHDLNVSHRHLSPYMAIYPLQLLNIDNPDESTIIKKSLHHIEQKGTRAWCGYSFSWMANIYANAKEGDSAAKMLKIFATNFCGINSFHLNGDQKGGQYSGFTYRPFTLEGNFAFAQGVQEMLLQSQNDIVQVFPAVPLSWKNISFKNLRAQGAFLVSAKKENERIEEVKIFSEKGGLLKMKLPFINFYLKDAGRKYSVHENILMIHLLPKEEIMLKNTGE